MAHDTDTIKKTLNERDGFSVWWRLLRPHTLTASFIPVFVGTVFAYVESENFHLLLFLAMMLAAVLIQAATNMFNEYYDFVRGLDNEKSVGIGGTIVRDGIQPKTVLRLAFIFYGIAFLLGVYICFATSWWIAAIGAVSMLIGYLYTGGPIPIAYTPFGELFSGGLMGTVMIGISYFIQANTITIEMVFVSLPIAIFIGALLMSNNIRDLENDKENGRKTLAILLGRNGAIMAQALFFIIAYVITIILIFVHILPIWSLIVLLSVPKAASVIKGFKENNTPLEMMPAMANTGKTNTMYGLLLGISILISIFI